MQHTIFETQWFDERTGECRRNRHHEQRVPARTRRDFFAPAIERTARGRCAEVIRPGVNDVLRSFRDALGQHECVSAGKPAAPMSDREALRWTPFVKAFCESLLTGQLDIESFVDQIADDAASSADDVAGAYDTAKSSVVDRDERHHPTILPPVHVVSDADYRYPAAQSLQLDLAVPRDPLRVETP